MYDVIIIGGGPSGLMTCCEAIKKYKKVLLIEKNEELGKKLLASGNGRCNVTNLKSDVDFIKNIQSSNNKFILSGLSEFGPWDIYSYFFDNNCPLKEEDDNRVFPESDKAIDILNVLKKNLGNTIINLSESLINLKKEENFIVETDKGIYESKKVVLSLGGKSYPNLGTTGDGYKILDRFNLKIEDLYPALTSLNSNDKIITDKLLQGITLENCTVKYNKSFTGNVLFTHFGVSGPGIFKVSESVIRNLKNKPVISIDMISNYSIEELMEEANSNQNETIANLFKDKIQARVIKVLLKDDFNKKINSFSQKKLIDTINIFKDFKLSIYDSKGFKSAFVTSGGLSLNEVNPKTLEVKKIEGLYVTGELLDIHAYTGGYNITIALSTGYKVGNNL